MYLNIENIIWTTYEYIMKFLQIKAPLEGKVPNKPDRWIILI